MVLSCPLPFLAAEKPLIRTFLFLEQEAHSELNVPW